MRNTTTTRWRSGHAGFTLVELLVVIAIIGTLAALLLVAARGALAAAKRAQIRAETTQIATALEDYKNSVGSYPPNTQTDGPNGTGGTEHLSNSVVLSNFKRHFNKTFPNQREPQQLIEALVGMSGLALGGTPTLANQGATNLPGGMNAAEAMVFWMGGFSDDPKYPISGPRGPGYSIETVDITPNLPNQADPITDRNWRLGINVAQLGPRDADSYFPAAYTRYIEYWNPRTSKINRINFWYLKAPGSEAPYVYFDASRGSGASGENDTPAATQQDNDGNAVSYGGDTAMLALFNTHAIKARQSNANADFPYTYANDGKFQILHTGIDGVWGSFPMVDPDNSDDLIDAFEYHDSGIKTPSVLIFPDGPWTAELADTQTNFSDGTLEDSQP